MYTRATQKFGSWKTDHWLSKRQGSSPAYNFVLSLAFLAFVSWLIFFITLKIRGEFYFFETSKMNIPEALDSSGSNHYTPYRTPAAAVGVVSTSSQSLSLIFDDGTVFTFPDQSENIKSYLEGRFRRLELTAMLTKIPSSTIGRIQIWAERDISFQKLHQILDLLTRIGFDEFDFALAAPPKAKQAAYQREEAPSL